MNTPLSITEANKARSELLEERHGYPIPANTELEYQIYHAINGYVPANVRHITVDELPKVRTDKRNGYPDHYKKAPKKPARIGTKIRAKRASALIRSCQNGHWDRVKREWVYADGDHITHTATGRVWDATTGATPEEFLEVLS